MGGHFCSFRFLFPFLFFLKNTFEMFQCMISATSLFWSVFSEDFSPLFLGSHPWRCALKNELWRAYVEWFIFLFVRMYRFYFFFFFTFSYSSREGKKRRKNSTISYVVGINCIMYGRSFLFRLLSSKGHRFPRRYILIRHASNIILIFTTEWSSSKVISFLFFLFFSFSIDFSSH